MEFVQKSEQQAGHVPSPALSSSVAVATRSPAHLVLGLQKKIGNRAVQQLLNSVGRDVVFGAGQFAPGTRRGDRLLAHELTQVVQQHSERPVAKPEVTASPAEEQELALQIRPRGAVSAPVLQREEGSEWSTAGPGASDKASEWTTSAADGSSVGSQWSAGPGASGPRSEGSQWSAGPGASGPGTDQESEESVATASFRAPWIQEFEFSPDQTPGYLNYTGSRGPLDSAWVKDREGSALLAVLAGLVTTEVLGFFAGIITPFADLTALFLKSPQAGAALAFWRAYTGFQVQRRVSAELVTVHQWYGRYLLNVIDKGIDAVDFRGIGPNFNTYTTAMLEERLSDADGNVLYNHPPNRLPMGFDLASSQNLPEFSFNTEKFD